MASDIEGSTPKVQRDERGLFLPGSSANPGGRRALPEWLKGATDDLLRVQMVAALEGRLPLPVMTEAEQAEMEEMSHAQRMAVWASRLSSSIVSGKERLAAAERLLDRVLGRAAQSVEVGTNAGELLLRLLQQPPP